MRSTGQGVSKFCWHHGTQESTPVLISHCPTTELALPIHIIIQPKNPNLICYQQIRHVKYEITLDHSYEKRASISLSFHFRYKVISELDTCNVWRPIVLLMNYIVSKCRIYWEIIFTHRNLLFTHDFETCE